ncbi:hypothetical protein M3J09_009544 [Ascochyta lentis]
MTPNLCCRATNSYQHHAQLHCSSCLDLGSTLTRGSSPMEAPGITKDTTCTVRKICTKGGGLSPNDFCLHTTDRSLGMHLSCCGGC